MPAIDVLLPIKNAMPFLPKSIESVCRQTFGDWRLLILDHGSTDGSSDLAWKFAELDPRILVFNNAAAAGLAELLNFGLSKADSKLVLRQDGDDISLPDRFQLTLDAFNDDSSAAVIGGEAFVIDSAGKQVGYTSHPSSSLALSAATFFYNPFIHPAVALNLSAMNKVGALYGRDFLKTLPVERSLSVSNLAEDYFLFGQLMLVGPCVNIGRPLIKYRVHDQSVGGSKRAAQNACALSISRFLAASFSAMNGTAAFDPAPFCTHGGTVFDLGCRNYDEEYARMSNSLRRGLGYSAALARELAFRRVLANRNSAVMSTRYAFFVKEYGFRAGEYRLVRNWIARFLSGKTVTRIEGGLVRS